ncbi:PREDICTED: sentrin-specific protease 1-like [Ceratosolen solmsi marchali]|uniref:Sentrin-specific protease 1-like n=1 Tax=Ceratosolen solmsi marchali TaxID=326594 RepID=A0AAJ6YQM6_9HYME|nr:PREDICTED: sentrin-specific protease 1-like [Ceratosolen solmsi marchali]
MIFEFFKKLFWKADESSRKRKASDSFFHVEDNIHSKKYCHDFVSCNHVKIISEANDSSNIECIKMNSNCYSHPILNSKQFDNDNENGSKKIKSLQSTIKTNHENNKCLSKKNYISLQQSESINQLTLFKTHRLVEKKQYSEMLMNFIPPEVQKINKDSSINRNQQHLIKIINLNENKNTKVRSSVNFESNTSMEVSKMDSCKSWFYLNKSNPFRIGYQKSVTNFNLVKEDEKKDIYINSAISYKPIEIIKTNTLREKFSNKEVIKQDFISQITNRYNKRMEECYKEAEELRKKTFILNKHNQLTREAALADQLNRSMRFYKAVLNENDKLEETKLPELNIDMLQRIKFALSAGPSDEILIQGFGLQITRKDIQTLAGLNWLNDEIINFYMNLLIIRGNCDKYPSVYAMNTFFYPKLCTSGHGCLKRWTRKVDIFSKDLIVVPIHLGVHWCLAIIDFRNKSIRYYDSMGSPNYKCLQILKQYLYEESIDKKKKTFDFLDWNFECIKDIPQQMNGSDCGVFSCMFAEYVCANKDLNFSQEQMPYFRNKMVFEILTSQIL